MATKKELAEIKEKGVLEFLAEQKSKLEREDINGDIIDALYEDEEVKRLILRANELKKELKSIETTLKEVDKIALDALKRRKIKKAETSTFKLTLVQQTRYELDKQSLQEFLSINGKTLEEFQTEKEVTYIRRTIKK